ncbi:hypothetical protein CsatB_030717 [Cannabis sativa]
MTMSKEVTGNYVMKPLMMEVAPALLDFSTWKYSKCPELETIVEDIHEEFDEDDENNNNYDDLNATYYYVQYNKLVT